MGLSCGNPTAFATLREGETVVDLGCGGGLDVFLAARKVGPTGKAIGIDMTPEMIALARKNRASLGADNVEFRLGEIEMLPVADATVDVIISNCVINLSNDKDAVFREAFRVLRPGGRFQVSDMVWAGEPPADRGDIESWAGCVAGALELREFVAGLERAGFRGVESVFNGSPAANGIASANITARKPE